MTSLQDFIRRWQQDALEAAGAKPLPPDSEWCQHCRTRPVSKFYPPFCSKLCRDAAGRAAVYDRR